MDEDIQGKLDAFKRDHQVNTKGPLALVIQLTDKMRDMQPPWKPEAFLTKGQGQVAGLGGPHLQGILKRYGMERTLAKEGGRTSRGNMGLMRDYVNFMEGIRETDGFSFDTVEEYWVEDVRQYFAREPFKLSADSSVTVAEIFDRLFDQVKKRQEESPGTHYLGTVLQHLVGAKLNIILPEVGVISHGAAVADSPTERPGDFAIRDSSIHCTTAPGQPLIEKCRANLESGLRPVIVTIPERVDTALALAADAGFKERVEVWDIRQFLATNINEWSSFSSSDRNQEIRKLVTAYNTIVKENESDPSLHISFDSE